MCSGFDVSADKRASSFERVDGAPRPVCFPGGASYCSACSRCRFFFDQPKSCMKSLTRWFYGVGRSVPENGRDALLMGIPCLYCDVSENVLMRGAWHRDALVSAAAGMIARIRDRLRSSVCRFGAFNDVGTILINATPLLRYDGLLTVVA